MNVPIWDLTFWGRFPNRLEASTLHWDIREQVILGKSLQVKESVNQGLSTFNLYISHINYLSTCSYYEITRYINKKEIRTDKYCPFFRLFFVQGDLFSPRTMVTLGVSESGARSGGADGPWSIHSGPRRPLKCMERFINGWSGNYGLVRVNCFRSRVMCQIDSFRYSFFISSQRKCVFDYPVRFPSDKTIFWTVPEEGNRVHLSSGGTSRLRFNGSTNEKIHHPEKPTSFLRLAILLVLLNPRETREKTRFDHFWWCRPERTTARCRPLRTNETTRWKKVW